MNKTYDVVLQTVQMIGTIEASSPEQARKIAIRGIGGCLSVRHNQLENDYKVTEVVEEDNDNG